MADMGEGVVPSDGASSGSGGMTDTGLPGKLSFLNPTWINDRVMNVAKKVDDLLDRIIDDGLLSEGFMPFESPISDAMLSRMEPGQFRILFDTIPSLEGKAQLLARMKSLKLPLPIELPKVAPPKSATAQLSFDMAPSRVVPSQGEN
jgi:hypothetical protein